MEQAQRIVQVGGGHAHIQVLRGLRDECRRGKVHITVIDQHRSAMYSGMMPGAVSDLYPEADCFIHLPPLTSWVGATFVEAKVTAIDTGTVALPLVIVWLGLGSMAHCRPPYRHSERWAILPF